MSSKFRSVKCVGSRWTALVFVANFAACVDDSVAPAPEATPPAQPRVLGFVELTFDGIGTPELSSSVIAAPTLEALDKLRARRERSVEIRDVIASDLTFPDHSGGGGDGSIQFALDSRDQTVFDGVRYIRATLSVRNAEADGMPYDTERTNLTLVGVSRDSNVNGTALTHFRLANGTPAPDALALQVLPADPVVPDGPVVSVADPDALQVFREAEVAPATLPPPVGVTTVFPWGFVVRLDGSTTSRTLPASPDPSTFTGVVDLAFSVPQQPDPADDPQSFSVLMLALDDSHTHVTHGLQEQNPDDQVAVQQRATSLGADSVTLLPGGAVPGFADVRTVCSVRTGGSSGTASGFLVNADWSNVSFSPNPGSVIPATTSFQATFDTAVYGIGANNFTVTGSLSGQAFTDTTYSGNGTNTITTPQGSFLPGEEVEIALLGPCPQPEIATYQVEAGFGLQRVASGLSSPIFVTHAPGDSGRLFIAERGGTIRILDLDTGTLEPTPFLTMTGISTQGEGGFLGLAFHPDYSSEGMPGQRKFFVNVTTDNTTITHIREFEVSAADPSVADPGSLRQILSFSQPQANHNGGWIGFSPNDGYLYIATGDGGGSNDNATGHTSGTGNAQDITDNLLGKMLRIDVDSDDFPGDPDRNYAIPSTNPFVGMTGDDELWAYGLRNPFRASFDRLTGDLWIGDVGQGAREEIDFQPASSTGGENYGWRLREGTIATPSGDVGGPPPVGNVDPVYDYGRSTGPFGGTIVTGGYVYRGPDPSLQGKYFFLDSRSSSDTADDNYWMFDAADPLGTVTNIDSLLTPDTGSAEFPVSFGEDAVGNLYIAYLTSGEVYRIVLEIAN